MKKRDWAGYAGSVIMAGLCAWMFFAVIVFAVRHPWITQNHQLSHLVELFTLGKVEKGCHE